MTNNELRRHLFDCPDQEISFGEFADDFNSITEIWYIANALDAYGWDHSTVEEVRTAIFNLSDQDAEVNILAICRELEIEFNAYKGLPHCQPTQSEIDSSFGEC